MEQLPKVYDQDYLEVLVIDPEKIFVYWELSNCTAKVVRPQEGAITLELRVQVFGGTGEAGEETWYPARQVTIPPETDHLYLAGLPSGAVCRVLIGNVAGQDCFNVLLTSPPVAVPPASPGETPELLGRPVGVPGSPAWLAGWHS